MAKFEVLETKVNLIQLNNNFYDFYYFISLLLKPSYSLYTFLPKNFYKISFEINFENKIIKFI